MPLQNKAETSDHPNKLLLLELARQFFAEIENLSVNPNS
jgi:hypothetical protein